MEDTDPREAKKQLEKAFRKRKISRVYYEAEMRLIDQEILDRQKAESDKTLKSVFSANPNAGIRDGHVILKLTCPSCGTEGENVHGHIEFKILGKDRSGFLYFECPSCNKHLQYDPMTGNIKTQRGLLGYLFGIFR